MTEYFEEGTAKICKENNTFFNPAQKLNRDISAEVIKSYFNGRDNIRILTSMSATGLRGIRYLNEIENSQLYFNDICPNSVNTIQKNLQMNGFNDFKILTGDYDIRNDSKRINITLSDCNVLMHRHHSFFDVIDIDPFGSCAEFVNSAFKAIKHNGIICFTCTDKAALCSNEDKCYVKYNTHIKRNLCKNETPIRVLLSYISREIAKYDASIIPLVSLSVDFYIRVIVRVYKGKPKSLIENNSFMTFCSCLNRQEQKQSNILNNICDFCGSKLKIYGPFWNKSLYDKNLISNILCNIKIEENERITGILKLMKQEIDDMFYYELPLICSSLKINSCKLKEIMYGLSNEGYKVSLTYFDNNSFKTNAPLSLIKRMMLFKIKGGEETFSFLPNKDVDKIFEENYFRGKIASGLKPLSLPKNDN